MQMQAKKKSLFTLDAPVSGGVIGADQGTLTFMVGGNSDVYNDIKFLFEIMGKNSILCGEEGAGQSAKICNNLLLATTMIAVGESFNLGKNLNLDLNKLFDVLSTSTGSEKLRIIFLLPATIVSEIFFTAGAIVSRVSKEKDVLSLTPPNELPNSSSKAVESILR